VIQSATIMRRPAATAAGFVVILFLGFAASAQTPSNSAVRPEASVLSLFQRLKLDSLAPRRGCFCDEDCMAASMEKQKASPIKMWQLGQPTFRVEPAALRLENDAPIIDLEILGKRSLNKWSSLPTFKVQSVAVRPDDIPVIDLDGLKKVLQRDPKDTRPLLLNFWATWCDPCREEFPDLVKLDADYKGKPLNFIAISIDDISDLKSEVPKFLNQMKATMPVVLLNMNDPEPAIKLVDPAWDGQLPATFLYDKDGKVVFRHFGKIKPDELRAAIDKEIKK